ncbi:Uncharacterized protein Adt_21187 [Abeliophyllum distichum]|uniref:Uncharacterized protein n=1 Tax=Abeliophyllum distichum TaxID=126358 RepID=A0ABD1SYN0_9LAMI
MKFLTLIEVATLKENQELAQECYFNALRKEAPRASVTNVAMMVDMATCDIKEKGWICIDDTLDSQILESNYETATIEELEEFPVSKDDQSKQLQIGYGLEPEMKRSLKKFLRTNIDVFA